MNFGLRNANWRQLLQEAHYRGIGSRVGEQTLYENGHQNIHVCRMLGLEKPTDIVNPNTEDLLCRHVSSPRCNPRACTDLDIPKAGQACQGFVSYYEGRGRKYNGVTYCYKHGSKTCVTLCMKILTYSHPYLCITTESTLGHGLFIMASSIS
eukprot:scaffold17327_cov67-Attheya_sp.AAC.7